MDAVSIRGDWVGQIIDDKFPLLEWLGGSSGSGVFATELAGSGSGRAAIKLIPASARAEDRLAVWSSACSLSHPHLLRIHHFGRAEIDDASFVYIVTDLADEALSEIIPERPLTSEETREMLGPVLEALAYLHQNSYVHGHLQPSNILVVENEIKLSSDALLPVGNPAPQRVINDIHVAPEMGESPVERSADMWSLGVTLVEALTQQPPIWDAASSAEPVVPTSMPQPFSAIARECLHPDPLLRCALPAARAMLEGRSKPVEPAPPLHLPHHRHGPAVKEVPSKMPLVPLVIGFLLLVAIIVALRMRSHKTQPAPLQTETTQQAPAAESESKAPPSETQPTAAIQSAASPRSNAASGSSGGDVVNRVLPEVPRSASNTIHGTVAVIVRVSADATGAVTNAEFESRGPSAYFARLALESARKWKFKPPQQNNSAMPSIWLLHFAFRRNGVEVTPQETSPK